MHTCGKCRAKVNVTAKYCKACGNSLSGTADSLEDKKTRVMNRERHWAKAAAIAAAVVLIAAAVWAGKGLYLPERMGDHPLFSPHRDATARLTNAVTVKDQAGSVRIPLTAIDDGKVHFFALAAGGKTVTFIVAKAGDGSIRTALDACVACNHAKLGYRRENDLVVCNNCGMGFKPTDIGIVTGGCSPIPVAGTVEGQMVILKTKDLEDGIRYF